MSLFRILVPGLTYGQRLDKVVDPSVLSVPPSHLLPGEYLEIFDNNGVPSVRRPAAGDIAALGMMLPAMSNGRRIDIQSGSKISLLLDKGAQLQNSVILPQQVDMSLLATQADDGTRANPTATTATLTSAGSDFDTVGILVGDTLTLEEGDADDGDREIIAVAAAVITVAGQFAVTGGSTDYSIKGDREAPFLLGTPVYAVLFQDGVDPSFERVGVSPFADDTAADAFFEGWPNGASDGTTPGLITGFGPQVGVSLKDGVILVDGNNKVTEYRMEI